jgi:Uma2 family endonuclease
MALRPQTRLFTVEEYYRMAEAGILAEDDRVELINGEIIRMAAIGSRHAACVSRLIALFSGLVAGRTTISAQNPLRLDDLSEPEPDFALLLPREDFYAGAHPGRGDVLLLIEVADSSLDFDRQTKVPLYAEAGISELWIVNLAQRQVEVFRNPGQQGFDERREVTDGYLTPLAFPDIAASLTDILGS